jgi:outer membrane protein
LQGFNKPLEKLKMKNLSLILNAVLIVAVGVLFYLQFRSGPTTEPKVQSPENTSAAPADQAIVYVNIDTLLHHYTYFQDMQDEFQDKQDELEGELNRRSQQYQASVNDYQNKLQKGLITRREAADLEQQLMQEQQDLLKLRDNLTGQLAEEEQVRNRRLINKIMEYLEVYNKDYHYQFIFSNSFGDNLLYANDRLDITYSVLPGLNAQYLQEKTAK